MVGVHAAENRGGIFQDEMNLQGLQVAFAAGLRTEKCVTNSRVEASSFSSVYHIRDILCALKVGLSYSHAISLVACCAEDHFAKRKESGKEIYPALQ